jgi:peptide deformylase
MIRTILIVPDPRLRAPCKRVTKFDSALQSLIDDMIETMHAAPGCALSAPQVGEPLRLFVVDDMSGREVLVFANPEITRRSQTSTAEDETCLSDRQIVQVRRCDDVTIRAQDRHGAKFAILAKGDLGSAIQQEYDHVR